ncbi:MAG: ATPase [Deltaproteobacteria bacterium]|nr:MAG: ATPase [Deltaproteobacteria bacterium]
MTVEQDRAEGALPYRPLPQTIDDLKVPDIFLANLVLKHCFYLDVFKLADLEERLKLSIPIIMELLDYLNRQKYIEILGTDPYLNTFTTTTLNFRYALTTEGKKRAAHILEYDAYIGPAPVTLEDYWDQVTRQSIKITSVSPERLQEGLQGLVVTPELINQLGPALMSGKPLFLYGPPGNGKTTIALRLGQMWDDVILIPYAIYVEGQIVRLFDEMIHRPVPAPGSDPELIDRRWLRTVRPTVIVGGELTLDMLDLSFSPTLKYYEAPLQLKANNGMLIVDDFGRQHIAPHELLNRWIIPMENHQDLLCLHTGQKFTIPFDLFLVFATNLEPTTLIDDAFLRRIRSKVKLTEVSREQFIEIFRLVCQHYEVQFDLEAVEYLVNTYYADHQRRMDACHPRDLVEHILDHSRFHRVEPTLSKENLDRACNTYFVY